MSFVGSESSIESGFSEADVALINETIGPINKVIVVLIINYKFKKAIQLLIIIPILAPQNTIPHL